MGKLDKKIKGLFDEHRIIFWHDTTGQFQLDYEFIELDACVKHTLGTGDFKLRNEIYHGIAKLRYLIYHSGELPRDEENYLLDIILSCKNFRADKTSDILEVLGLEDHYRSLVESHQSFFNHKERTKRFQGFIAYIKDEPSFYAALLAAVLKVGTDAFDIVIQGLVSGYHQEKRWVELHKLGLGSAYAEMLSGYLNYEQFTDVPTQNLKVIFLNYSRENFKQFLDRWRRDLNYQADYNEISEELYDKVIAPELDKHKPGIYEIDLFKQIEYNWLVQLTNQLREGFDYHKILEVIADRQQSYWYSTYKSAYETIFSACHFFLNIANFSVQPDLQIIIKRYAEQDFLIDKYYRQYYHRKRMISIQAIDFGQIDQKMDNYYETDFLTKVNLAFSSAIAADTKNFGAAIDQHKFFDVQVRPLLEKKNKVAVIISDAFRYEVGHEFVDAINQENRFNASLDYGICMVPSFTQIGMAALLPNEEITLLKNATCKVDGTLTTSLANREKLLKAQEPSAKCIEVREFKHLNTHATRDLLKDLSLVYIYSNVVDNTGDKRLTEKDTFKSVHEEIENLQKVVTKLASANFTNIIITADHGFVYRSKQVEAGQKIMEDEKYNTVHKNRRFLMTESKIEDNRLVHIPNEDLPYHSEYYLSFPKALNIFKVSGAGMQFLHGGLAIQEVVIPYVKIRKERKESFDLRKVEIEVLSAPKRVSGYQAVISLLQKEEVGEKMQARNCKIGFYTADEKSLSNQVELLFNNDSSEIRNRESRLVFNLSSDIYNYHGEKILFIIYEKDEKFNHYSIYFKKEIQVFISEEKDFDL